MKLAPAPRRVARTWSVLALGAVALTDVTLAFVHAMTDVFITSVPVVLAANAGAALVVMIFRFAAQQIEITNVEKVDLLRAVANAPMLPLERDVTVVIDKVKVQR